MGTGISRTSHGGNHRNKRQQIENSALYPSVRSGWAAAQRSRGACKIERWEAGFVGAVAEAAQDFGYFPSDRPRVGVECEPDGQLRDPESIPLADPMRGYVLREVKPHVEDTSINLSKTTIGYEISFNKYFYKRQPLRSSAEAMAEILQLEAETEGLLKNLVNFAGL
ncbi:hypothetical protein H6G51_09115 [Limnothrix sp. FACHB-708]|uniref:hypothetical protein n=1 Tax=unclassified Limnothrix TaxID=2632864 RepID=UPI0016844BB8|nr:MULTISPECIES: hypothetical protein [unclassified Limnothrix]MBD2553435.1 hypothetical protein [Limnothrix sp. FACHB-708]MBD2590475.1 hypothetical protein [Limnothrix sp. FACHB-406]